MSQNNGATALESAPRWTPVTKHEKRIADRKEAAKKRKEAQARDGKISTSGRPHRRVHHTPHASIVVNRPYLGECPTMSQEVWSEVGNVYQHVDGVPFGYHITVSPDGQIASFGHDDDGLAELELRCGIREVRVGNKGERRGHDFTFPADTHYSPKDVTGNSDGFIPGGQRSELEVHVDGESFGRWDDPWSSSVRQVYAQDGSVVGIDYDHGSQTGAAYETQPLSEKLSIFEAKIDALAPFIAYALTKK